MAIARIAAIILYKTPIGYSPVCRLALFAGDHFQHFIGYVEAAKYVGDCQRNAKTAQKCAECGCCKMGCGKNAENDYPVKGIHA